MYVCMCIYIYIYTHIHIKECVSFANDNKYVSNARCIKEHGM